MTPEELHLRDEVLQVLFWRKGEGLGEEASAKDIGVFLASPETTEAALATVLAEMHRDALIEHGDASGAYRLTAQGHKEGARRFGDAFTGLGPAHGSCGPECEDCLVNGPDECSAHKPHTHAHEHEPPP